MKEGRTCSICGHLYPFSAFSPNGNGKLRSSCKKCEAEKAKARRHKNLKEYNRKRREYNAALPEQKQQEKRGKHRRYYAEHREELVRKKIESHKNKLANDPIYARKKELQCLVNRILHRGQTPSPAIREQIESILGCGLETFRKYFFGTWEKEYGEKWCGQTFEIDHIAPLNNAKTIEDVEKLFFYKNLRCITPFDNKHKYMNPCTKLPTNSKT